MQYLEGYKAIFAEGPFWDEQRGLLLYVDLAKKAVVNHDLQKDEAYSWYFDTPITAIMKKDAAHYVLVTNQKLLLFNHETEQVSDYFVFDELEPYHLLNDAKMDRFGNIWVGTVDDRFPAFKEHPDTALANYPEAPSKLYKLTPDKQLQTFDFAITLSNGIAFNEEQNIMYHVDSAAQAIWKLTFDDQQALVKRELFFESPMQSGFPDGISIDENGHLWVALFQSNYIQQHFTEPSKVIKLCGETATVLEEIILDVPHVTSCLYGGPTKNSLFVTTATEMQQSDTPRQHAGKIAVVQCGKTV